jgi:hypothetical protein
MSNHINPGPKPKRDDGKDDRRPCKSSQQAEASDTTSAQASQEMILKTESQPVKVGFFAFCLARTTSTV